MENIRKKNPNFKVYGTKSKDIIIDKDNTNTIVRIDEISNDCNKLTLREGRMPQNENEMLMEHGIEEVHNIKVGDVLNIDDKQIKIVGSALSTDFIVQNKMSVSRGTSSLGAGGIGFFLYAPKEYFDFDNYTAAYIVDDGLASLSVTSDEYKELLRKDKDSLEDIKDELEKEKYQKFIKESNSKIDEEEAKANEELAKAKSEIDDGKVELDNAKEKLNKTKSTLDSSKMELDSAEKKVKEYEGQLNEAEGQLKQAEAELASNKKLLDDSKSEIDKAEAELNKYEQKLNSSKAELDAAKQQIVDGLTEYNFTYEGIWTIIKSMIDAYGDKEQAIQALVSMGAAYDADPVELENGVTAIIELEDGFAKIEEARKELDNQKVPLIEAKGKYDEGYSQYQEALEKYNAGYTEFSTNKKELEKQKKELKKAKEQYNFGIEQYEDGVKQYEEGYAKYEASIEEYNKSKADVEKKIQDSRNELARIKDASLYISDRNDNYEYSTYLSLCKSFENLSKTFPVIFFVVTIFICLLLMARMAIENRTEIGTLKALGYTNKEIRVKYIIYSLLATLIGGVTGGIVGNYALSYMCYAIFSDIYQVPVYESTTNIAAGIIGNGFAILAIVGATLVVINQLLKHDATTLLRPITPPIGKKILLEKIKPFWSHMSFSNKIMARNIFRYKRRVIASLIGFIGCTSLLMSGYAIRDSMVNVIDKQFAEISDYDEIVNIDGELNESELDDVFSYDKIKKIVYVKTSLVEFKDSRATIIVPNDADRFKTIFNLKDAKNGEQLNFKTNEIIVTKKLAENLNKRAGEELEFVDSDHNIKKFKISAIAENYVDNYIYMDKQTYIDNKEEFIINCAFVKFDSLDNTEGIISELNENDHVLIITSVTSLKKSFKNMLTAFDNIIIVLVIFSAVLSFVVMYSLAYITLSERQKEIATLMTLGYYQKDIDKYILKEQLNIVVLGIILGIVAGSIYSNILVQNINFSQLYLVKQIELASYFKTGGCIALFAFIIGIKVHYMLKKIKMVESLKSVE